MERARLTRYGLLSVKGADARDFLHAQLTNDVANLGPGEVRLAGWCSAKGRLLATMLVIPAPDGFLLQLASDLAAPVAKRLRMFVLRSKVKIEDESGAWNQYGAWDTHREGADVVWAGDGASIRVGERRYVELSRQALPAAAAEAGWTLQEIRAGRPLITAATQDLFVPQMVNLEKIGGVDFHKGCYPGQEIVARAQYRGEVKRRMVRVPAPAGALPAPGAEFNGGVVVDSAPGELLAVLPA